jgi:hypothetical protein
MAGALTMIWGIAHLFPTRNVVRDFGEISQDNKHIITMEWIIEGVILIFLGVLLILVTSISPMAAVSTAVYWSVFVMLNVLSIVSIFTGFKVNFLPFKLCPVIFTISAALILIGIIIK